MNPFFSWDHTVWIPFSFEVLHIESSISLRSYILNYIFLLNPTLWIPFFLLRYYILNPLNSLRSYIWFPFFSWILYFFEILHFESLISVWSYILNPLFLWDPRFWIPYFFEILHFESIISLRSYILNPFSLRFWSSEASRSRSTLFLYSPTIFFTSSRY